MSGGERDLLMSLRNGNSKAFEHLYKQYAARIFSFSKRFFHSQDEAKEIVQRTFVNVWEHYHTIDPDKSFSSYLFTIARNLIMNQMKREVYFRAYTEYVLFKETEFSFVTDHQILFNELQQILAQAIQLMPEKRREIFLLSRENGLSYKEIADKLAITESTVNTQITKALAFLKNYLDLNHS